MAIILHLIFVILTWPCYKKFATIFKLCLQICANWFDEMQMTKVHLPTCIYHVMHHMFAIILYQCRKTSHTLAACHWDIGFHLFIFASTAHENVQKTIIFYFICVSGYFMWFCLSTYVVMGAQIAIFMSEPTNSWNICEYIGWTIPVSTNCTYTQKLCVYITSRTEYTQLILRWFWFDLYFDD